MKESVSTRSSCSRTRIENTKYRTEGKIIPHKFKLPQPPLSQPFEPKCSPKDEQQTRNLQSEQIEQLVSENNPLVEFMLNLQTQQNNLNQQQNEIMKGFSDQQRKSSLPTPQVPMFDGDPMEYDNFIRAFENIIETKVQRDVERLYYLEQYTVGDAK